MANVNRRERQTVELGGGPTVAPNMITLLLLLFLYFLLFTRMFVLILFFCKL